MDERRFDRLTRLLAGDGASRRRIVLGLAGGLAGALAELGRGEDDATARTGGCFKKKKRCRHHQQCCSGRCRDGRCKGNGDGGNPSTCSATCGGCCSGKTCQAGTSDTACGQGGEACVDCGDNAQCSGGDCLCDEGFDACDGECVDMQTDPDHCGLCGKICEGGTECVGGICNCPEGTRDCNGRCIGLDDCCGVCITLSWGETPTDLDSHGWTPDGTEVYFAAKGTVEAFPFMELDVDDITSFGPEQISISQLLPGATSYAVHNYSDRCEENNVNLAASGATVQVVRDGEELATFTVPTDGVGVWWDVFEIGDDGVLTEINEVSDTPPRPTGLPACTTASATGRANDDPKGALRQADAASRPARGKTDAGKNHERHKHRQRRRGKRAKRN